MTISSYSLVTRGAGTVLVVAAMLKLYGLTDEPIAATALLLDSQLQLAVTIGEVLLAAWLFTGKHPLGAWITVLAAFIGFAAASLYLGWVGQASCGCFGKLSVSPWQALAADLIVVGALLIVRPKMQSLRQFLQCSLADVAHAIGVEGMGVVGLLMLMIVAASGVFGSPRAAIAYFRGELVSVSPRLSDLGKVAPGSHHQVTVELSNWSDRPIRVVGGTLDCVCDANDSLPLTVPAGGAVPLTINVRFPRDSGFFYRSAMLRTDGAGAPTVIVHIVGRIAEE